MPTLHDWFRHAAGVKILLRQLEAKFGELPASVKPRLENKEPEEIDDLLVAVLNAKSLKELGLVD